MDVYFILRDHHTLTEISEHAVAIFGNEYNEKLIREQLSYFDDVNYTEQVVYRPGYAVEDDAVKRALEEYSLAV